MQREVVTLTDMKQKSSILALDRWKKYIWCAYVLEDSSIVFPVGYLLNDNTFGTGLAEMITRYRVKHIVLGLPRDERAHKQIEQFAQFISKFTPPAVEIEMFDEDYTSVQAGEKIWNFQKNVAEDTLAAMLILERWVEANKKPEGLLD